MIKYSFLLIYLLFISNNSFSQTTIPSGNVSGTWTKAGSPYKIMGEITVPKGSTLVLEPGTVLEFQDSYGFIINGIIKAQGNITDSIVFTSVKNKGWSGIQINNNIQTNIFHFNYCKFDKVKYGFLKNFLNCAIFIRNSNPLKISNSSFHFTENKFDQGYYIYSVKNELILDSLLFTSNADTIRNSSSALYCVQLDSVIKANINNIKVENIKTFSTFISIFNSNAASLNDIVVKNMNIINSIKCGGFVCVKSRRIIIEDIQIESIRQGFLLSDFRNSIIKNVKIEKVKTAIRTEDNCISTTIENSIIKNCGDFKTKSNYQFSLNIQSNGPLFKNCKMLNNQTGIAVFQDYGAGTPLFLNCEFKGSSDRALTVEGYPVLINCNIVNNVCRNTPGSSLPYFGGVSVITEFYPSRPFFYNCILWGNKDSLGHNNSIVMQLNNSNIKAYLNNCLIQGDSSKGIIGYNDDIPSTFKVNPANITYINSSGTPPGFIDSANNNYNLINNCNQRAYAINRGMSGNLLTQYPYNTLLSQYGVNIYNTTDLNGNQRITDDTIDIGCYESSGTKKSLKLHSNYNDTTMCYGASKTYTSKSAGTVQTYLWQQKQSTAISTVSNQSTLNLNKQKTSGLQYRLKVINNECLPLQDSSRWFTITINNPLKKGYSRIPNKDTIALSDTMTLSTNPSGYKSILWSTGATTNTIKFKGANLGPIGKYQFTIEAESNTGCTETDTLYIHTKKDGTSITNLTNTTQIKLYPNPAQDEITIEGKELVKIQVFNTHGQLIIEKNTEEDIFSISTKQLPTGIYYLKAIDKQNRESVVRLMVN